MKPQKTILLVGDKFHDFSDKHDNIITLTELERLIWNVDKFPATQIIVGQGVCHRRVACAQAIMHGRFPNASLQFINYEQIADQLNPTLREITHKLYPQNILISVPFADMNGYRSKLAIHDAAELLGDHMTGQHIQGMVLTEAARQMMLAVAELFMLTQEERRQCYFVLSKVSSAYHRFAFPIETDVRLFVINSTRKKGNSLHAEVRIEFIQQDEVLAEVDINFAAYDQNFIAKKEHELATTRVRHINPEEQFASVEIA